MSSVLVYNRCSLRGWAVEPECLGRPDCAPLPQALVHVLLLCDLPPFPTLLLMILLLFRTRPGPDTTLPGAGVWGPVSGGFSLLEETEAGTPLINQNTVSRGPENPIHSALGPETPGSSFAPSLLFPGPQ